MVDNAPDPRPTRKEREQEFRKNLVLDAAREVFMEKPFAAARIEEIAQRAELSVGTLYNLFESKEQIYYHVVSQTQAGFFEELHRKLDAVTEPHEQVRTMVDEYFKLFKANLNHWKFHVYANAGLSSEIRNDLFAEVTEQGATFIQRLAGICAHGIEQGVFEAGIPPEMMAVAIHSIPHSYLGYIFEHEGIDPLSLVPEATEAVDRIVGAKTR